jgi:hypothetical protein
VTFSLPSRHRQTVLVFAMLLVSSILLVTIVKQLGLRGEEVTRKRQALGGLNALLAHAGKINDGLALYQGGEEAGLFFKGSSAALITADLQRRLQAIITASKARFVRDIDYAMMRLELSGPMENLARTVIAIESALPPLLVERAEFSSDPLAATQPDRPSIHMLKIDVAAPMQLAQPLADERPAL